MKKKIKKLGCFFLAIILLCVVLISGGIYFLPDVLLLFLEKDSFAHQFVVTTYENFLFKVISAALLFFCLYYLVPYAKKMPPLHMAYLGISFLFLLMFLSLPGTSHLTHGKIHDLWIPQIIAHAVKHNVILHQDFHTPFGFIYAWLNYTSLLLIEWMGLQAMDMIMISSILFSLLILLVFYLIYLNTKKVTPYIILFFVLSLVPQFRNTSSLLDYNNLLSYCSYNNHLWALLLLQITHLFYWEKMFIQKNFEQNKRDILLFSLIQALCIYISFNYKFSFFISSILITASILLISPRSRIRCATHSILFFFILVLFTQIFTQYSYSGYLQDIYHAITSRQNILRKSTISIVCQLIAICLFLSIRIYRIYAIRKDKITFFSKQWLFITRGFFFDMFIGLAILISIIGDYFQPYYYSFLTVVIYCIVHIRTSSERKILSSILLLLAMVNILSLIKFSSYTFYNSQSKNIPQAFTKYQSIKIETKSHDYDLVILKDRYTTDWLLHTFSEEDLFAKLFSKKAIYKIKNSYEVSPFHHILNTFKDMKLGKDDKIFMLDYVDPLPVFLDKPPIKGSYHWIHYGVSFSEKNIFKIYKTLEQSDFIYLTFPWTNLNCVFYKWNIENKRFVIISVHPYGILLATEGKTHQYHLSNFQFPQRLFSSCH